MHDPRLTDYAVAVRMTCAHPDAGGRPVPPRVTYRGAAETAPAAAFQASAGVGPEALAAELAAYLRSGSEPVPDAVAVPGAGWFEVRPMRTGERLAGCAALVTGSAQGFGRGIAEELAAAGADVVVADINDAVGEAFTAELRQRHGADSAAYCHMDVTRLDSVEAGVALAARTFGGLDLLIVNAGVLKAGGLEEMDEAAFDLVTRVNYKAYFLGAKAVAPLMKLQHRFNPRHMMDIVQINSKSGLTGSNRNFAYAGSKFGSIGLTQSFAMELVPFNIKVNAICPGNYFDGPLWSDPQNGLFVQYLRAGKVPGARTIEDVRESYLSKVPMRRGCLPRDVARAIFYVREQDYETGQAIPVTGGQVMLS